MYSPNSYYPDIDETDYGIYSPSPGEGSSWEVNLGSMSGGAALGMEGIYAAKNAIDNLQNIYGNSSDEAFDIDTVGGLGEPDGPALQGESTIGSPVNIVLRNEAGEQTGISPGIRIGYGDNSTVISLDELVGLNNQRKSQGLDIITAGTPGFVPEYVDESGSVVDAPTPTTTTVSEEPMVTGGGTPVELNPDGTPVTDTGLVSGGGGMREIRPGVFVPEGLSLTELLRAGHITKEIYDSVSSELRKKTPDELDNTTSTNTDMTDAELNGLEDDPNFTGEFEGQQYENGTLVSSDVSGDLSSSSATGGNASASGGEGGDSSSSSNVGDIDAGDASASVGNIDAGGTGGAGGSGGTGGGGTGGNVTVNFGDGSGDSNAGYEKFFEMINSYIASGEPIKEGEVKGIYEQFIETSPQSADAIRSFLALDRPVSEDQAELKTDIYKDIIGDVREAQSPLMKSLTRRSEMQGAEAERLMGPLSFLEGRDATQAGYGQAVSGGRGLGNISGMLAGRERAEQKNVNLQLAGNLLGQQRATAGLMADVESGIYSQMAPDIGLDFGSLLGISGVDVQNILGERQSTRAANAAERGANIKLGIEAVPTVLGGIKTGYDWIKGLGN